VDHSDESAEETRRRPLVWLTVLATLGGAVTVLGMAGGLAATPGKPRQAGPNTAVDQGRFTVTVLGARVGMVKGLFSQAAKRSLIVKMRVVNNGTDTASVDVSFVHGLVGEPKPGTYKEVPDGNATATTSDGSKTSSIEPGLPVTAEVSWELPAGTTPAKMTLALRQWEYHPGFTDVEYIWFMTKSSPVMAEITVPVQAS
jgi:hypothetical protein